MSHGSFQNLPVRFRLGMAFPWQNRWFFGAFLLQLLAISGCNSSQRAAPANGQKRHIVLIGLRDNNKPIIQYGGDGMLIGMGWSQKTKGADYEIDFKGQHPPADAVFKLGDTNYQDSTITGTLSLNATNDALMAVHLTIDSKVPVEIQFQGISDATASGTNDAVFTFEAGQHVLQFSGKVIALFDNN